MPVEITLRRDLPLLHLRFRGHVTLIDMLKAQNEYLYSDDFMPGVDELVEFLPGSDLDLTFDQMRQIRRKEEGYYDQSAHQSRKAILAPGDAQYGMGRMYATLVDLRGDVQCEVFGALEEALEFLELSDAMIERS